MTDEAAILATLEDDLAAAVKKAMQAGAHRKQIITGLSVSAGTSASMATSPEECESLLTEAAAIARRCSLPA